jgi:ankyrin repeat protein
MNTLESLRNRDLVGNQLGSPAVVSDTAGKEIEPIYQSNVVETQAILASLQQKGTLFEINSRYYRNYSPLAGAASRGELEKVKLLVEQGGAKDYLIRPDGFLCEGPSALSAAACSAQVTTVDYLLSQGAKLDQTMRDFGHGFFQFPYLVEAYCQNEQISSKEEEQSDFYERQYACLRLVLNSVKDLKILHGQLSMCGKNCLQLALYSGRRDLVELLLEFSFTWADLEEENVREKLFSQALSKGHLSLIQWFVETYKININGPSKLPHLHIAKANRKEEVVQYLLQQGAEPSFVNDQGEDYLTYARRQISLRALQGLAHHFQSMAGFNEFQDFDECLSFLRPEDINRIVDRKGNTLLHLAAQWPAHNNFYENFLPPLIKIGADLSFKNKKGEIPFVIGYDVIANVYTDQNNEQMLLRLHILLPQ